MSKVKRKGKGLDDELAALAAKKDEDIDTRDIPEITDWSGVERGRFYRPVKQAVSLRIDADVLAWFRSLEGKYQTNINRALRDYMNQHRRAEKTNR